ncbi:MAG TPA: S8 family serine peptidase, partial [Blastocatellia bacterium]|nr:S8 family serine peptidase [Blastocatellia bacterium]
MKTGHLGPRAVAEQIFPSHVAGSRPVESTGAPGLYQIDLDRSMSVEQAVSQAKNDPRVDFAEPNYYYYPAETVPNDTLFFQEWDMANSGSQPPGGKAGADIEATRAWDITTGSDNVVAAVIDTGVDLSNPDLAPNAWINPSTDDGTGLPNDINGWNFLSNNNLVFDPNTDVGGDRGHGTHVAGTIGAVGDNGMLVAGVAWHVKIMVLKFLGLQSDGSVGGSTADAIKSINFVIAQKKLGINVRVINASWAGPNPSQG